MISCVRDAFSSGVDIPEITGHFETHHSLKQSGPPLSSGALEGPSSNVCGSSSESTKGLLTERLLSGY